MLVWRVVPAKAGTHDHGSRQLRGSCSWTRAPFASLGPRYNDSRREQALARHVAEQQQRAEGEHQNRRAELEPAQQDAARTLAALSEPRRESARADRKGRDRRDRDRGAEPPPEGRADP